MQEPVSNYVTQILLSLLALLAVLARIWLDGLKKRLENYYEAKTTAEQRQTLAFLGREAFSFAETVFKELDGPDKMHEAERYLTNKIKFLGITASSQEIRAVIEAAWLEGDRPE